MTTSPIALTEELQRFRKKLLDLSLRNPLLSYRYSQRRTIPLPKIDADALYQALVEDEQQLPLIPIPDPQPPVEENNLPPGSPPTPAPGTAGNRPHRSPPQPSENATTASSRTTDRSNASFPNSSSEDAPPASPVPSESSAEDSEAGNARQERIEPLECLQTEIVESRLEPICRNILSVARTAIEETGINYLHLAIGFLRWNESTGSTGELKRAPLILVPVALHRTLRPTGGMEFQLAWNEDEVVDNACLRKKLETDFAIELPRLEEEESPSGYCKRVEAAITSQAKQWHVEVDSAVGFFSFHKLAMYSDLDPSNWDASQAIAQESLADRLFGGSEEPVGTNLYAGDYDVDRHQLAKTIELPLDADSSQHSAITDIAAGRNLVIEGPPGTGKSQTIANAIAHAVEQGKTVLFVAEKLAALEVVHKRLAHAGLGNYCLELHGHSLAPRQIFDSLAQRLTLPTPQPPQNLVDPSQWESCREKLESYREASSRPTGPYNEPLHQLLWRIVQLRQQGAPIARDLPTNPQIDRTGFEEAIQALEAFALASSRYDQPQKSAWWGFRPEDLSPSASEQLPERLETLRSYASPLDQLHHNLLPLFANNPKAMQDFLANADAAKLKQLSDQGPATPPVPWSTFADPAVTLELEKASQYHCAWRQLQQQLEQAVIPGDRSWHQVAEELEVYPIQLLQSLPSAITMRHGAEAIAWIDHTITLLDKLRKRSDRLKAGGFGHAARLEDVEHAQQTLRLIEHSAIDGLTFIPTSWFSDASRKLVIESMKLASALQEEEASLKDIFHLPSVPASDRLSFLIKKFQHHGNSWLRWLSGEFRKVCKELQSFSTFPRSYRLQQKVESLQRLETFLSRSRQLDSDPQLAKLLGDQFQGRSSNWSAIKSYWDWLHTARRQGLDARRINDLLSQRDVLMRDHPALDIRQEIQELEGQFQASAAKVLGFTPDDARGTTFDELHQLLAEHLRNLKMLVEWGRQLRGGAQSRLEDLAATIQLAKKWLAAHQQLEEKRQASGVVASFVQAIDDAAFDDAPFFSWLQEARKAGLSHQLLQQIDRTGIEPTMVILADAAKNDPLLRKQWDQKLLEIVPLEARVLHWMASHQADGTPRIGFIAMLDGLKSERQRLPDWLAFCRTLQRCRRSGVEAFALAASIDRIAEDQLSLCYQATCLSDVAERALRESGIGTNFTALEMEDLRRNFQRLDRLVRESKSIGIARAAHLRSIPEGNAKGRVGEYTELALIRHEVTKKKRHCRIRDLVQRAGNALQGLKPCFLMSPLSLAKYLPAQSLQFDLVVMDEASQIRPEDAMGAILRARQLVVVGDPKQLPPTSFFDKIEEDLEDDEATQMDNAESILEVAQRSFQPYRRLRWHYRSQHESLIQFSNTSFYDEDLVIFPSPKSLQDGYGVFHHHVENAACVHGENLVEAQAIVEAICKHAMEQPELSLGVAAFNQKQSELIDGLLAKACSNDPHLAQRITQLREGDDGLFIKNLENIQGDERDVIFISYTYGPDPKSGKVFQRFGPINSAMGWRRLNVLVTRSRKRMEVFSSLHPHDIHSGPDKSRGINAYRSFLEYCIEGKVREAGSESGREPGSPFEESVARVIATTGLEPVFQVGVAGYFIDIGVRRRERDRSFLLGIECDGATYHSSKSARDRDRLREEIIRARGWNLYRIWSTEWFLNQAAEEERLRRTLAEIIARQPS
jgi:very-short-patch-repair endonuclease